ncbi:MAG: sulfite exporter TauE/SafE family protein [Kurthia sp.]|nr:sulfite exporter TauE/SafE family protein [Candidatus Kurthia equi]
MNELWTLVVVLFVLGFIGSLLSGMLGIGGAIIKFPLLLYIPPLFGLVAFSAHQVSGIIAVEVFFSSFIGLWAYRKDCYFNKELILYMGGAVLVGSFLGSYGSSFLNEPSINTVYGILALLATILMFIPKKENELTLAERTFPRVLGSVLAFIVGIGSGIVGAGGGFLLVPIMLTILKIPTRVTIVSSLAITFISSIGGSVGKIITGQIEYGPVLVLILASIFAVPLGAKLGKAMPTKALRVLLALLIAATAIKIWIDLLF